MRADLALIGFGRVGRRFATLLEDRRERLQQEHDLDCRIVAIATANHGGTIDTSGVDAVHAATRRESGQPVGASTTALDVITSLSRSMAPVRVVIETTTLNIQDGQPAISYAEAALDAGCHFVTANKGPVSFAYRRLSDRACRAGRSFLFEGAVMDGVPIFNLVREALPVVTVTGFRGIVNTTTQYVLSAIEHGESLAAALRRMQAEGIAESDPSLDLEGWDAAAKGAALANVLMAANVTPRDVERDGVTPEIADAARAAARNGRKLRLIVTGARVAGRVGVQVRLTEIDCGDLLATLPGTANALILQTDLLGELAICQMAGDLTQTAYALLSDLVTIGRRAAAEQHA